MTPSDRWRRIEAICHETLERDGPECAAFLQQACGDDHELRREVEALLAHARAADRFLVSPIGAVAAAVIERAAGPSLAAGTRLGSYEILAALGAGGMGAAYRARDAKLARD